MLAWAQQVLMQNENEIEIEEMEAIVYHRRDGRMGFSICKLSSILAMQRRNKKMRYTMNGVGCVNVL